ncbi:hypothetical protein BHE97_13380 [Aeromicrobium sp. PE09-221]|uniref:GAP family protein n=1 Tax=Aeromicrobium sp. PE09-221 TaxID=1898043 RepID=UPI000B3E4F3D|nr:GAP family protein [Aeromicrobium sp. PE09-221]OUZ08655.1 hypothetical protein BHE97_13380 [Aeromicrobium sp. PE09-221]
MTPELLAPLGVLALIDSTSFGTLLIPIWFLLTPGRLRAGRVLVFLTTVAGFYLAVGILLVAGLDTFIGDLDAFLDHPAAARVQLAIGATLLVWSFFIGKKKEPGEQGRPGRLMRWRSRVMADGGGILALIGIALAAALVEVATMLPYLAATGLISTADLSWAERLLLLAAYCFIMILPALVLTALRLTARGIIEPLLQRIARWMEKNGGETTAWIVGIVGFLIARDALNRVPEVLDFLSSL